MKRRIVALAVLVMLSNAALLTAMDAIEKPLQEQHQGELQIKTAAKTLGIGAIASLLGVSVVYLSYVVGKYINRYSLAVIVLAIRYEIPFARQDYLTILTYAKNHDIAHLKSALITLNQEVFGDNWQQARHGILRDYTTMDHSSFSKDNNRARTLRVADVLKVYSAAYDLYYRNNQEKIYQRGLPSTNTQEKNMAAMDRLVGIVGVSTTP
jgi:hypothetical protein